MLDILFNKTFWIVVLAVVLLIIVVVMCTKYPIMKTIALSILGLGIVISGVVSSIFLNKYYSAHGGIMGYIDGVVKKNQVEKIDEATLNILNLSFSVTSNDNEYIANFTSNELIELQENSSYKVLLNNDECNTIENGKDYLICEFTYGFYSRDNTVLKVDTLKINFSFFKNYTHISLSTTGGAEAVKYWNSYFKKNNIVLKLQKTETTQIEQIKETEVISTLKYVEFIAKDKTVLSGYFHQGSSINCPLDEDFYFDGWENFSEGKIYKGGSSYVVGEKNKFIARYDRSISDNEYINLALHSGINNGVLDLSIYPIKKIEAGILNGVVTINEIILPIDLKTIGGFAFEDCVNLKKIYIPKSVETIGEKAFKNCSKDLVIDLPYMNVDDLPETYKYAFEGSVLTNGETPKLKFSELKQGCWKGLNVSLYINFNQILHQKPAGLNLEYENSYVYEIYTGGDWGRFVDIEEEINYRLIEENIFEIINISHNSDDFETIRFKYQKTSTGEHQLINLENSSMILTWQPFESAIVVA